MSDGEEDGACEEPSGGQEMRLQKVVECSDTQDSEVIGRRRPCPIAAVAHMAH